MAVVPAGGIGEKSMHIDMTEANENMDMPTHVQTYRKFASMVKYSIGGIVVLLILMAVFLT